LEKSRCDVTRLPTPSSLESPELAAPSFGWLTLHRPLSKPYSHRLRTRIGSRRTACGPNRRRPLPTLRLIDGTQKPIRTVFPLSPAQNYPLGSPSLRVQWQTSRDRTARRRRKSQRAQTRKAK